MVQRPCQGLNIQTADSVPRWACCGDSGDDCLIKAEGRGRWGGGGKTTIHHFTLTPRTQRLQLNLSKVFSKREHTDRLKVKSCVLLSFSSSAAFSLTVLETMSIFASYQKLVKKFADAC